MVGRASRRRPINVISARSDERGANRVGPNERGKRSLVASELVHLEVEYAIVATAAFAVLALSPQASQAHHSFPAVYDPARLVSVTGVITNLELTNPHAIIYIDVTNDSGEIEGWVIEMPGKLSLARRGWTDETVVPGESITATGHPSRGGANAMWWQRMTIADGSELLFPALADQLAIEALRREQAPR